MPEHPVSIHRVRSPGSAAVNMCLVACGSADAYYHMGIHCWDMAGGAAVVTEAGGVIMDISGESLTKRQLFNTTPGLNFSEAGESLDEMKGVIAGGDFCTERSSENRLLLLQRRHSRSYC